MQLSQYNPMMQLRSQSNEIVMVDVRQVGTIHKKWVTTTFENPLKS